MKCRSREQGFTIVELMIVVALVAILAAIAVTGYGTLVTRAKRADGKAALEEVAVLQEKWRASDTDYGTSTVEIGYKGFGNCTDCSPKDHYTVTVTSSSATGYTATAAPKGSHSDSECGTLTLNQSGPVGSAAHIKTCWNR